MRLPFSFNHARDSDASTADDLTKRIHINNEGSLNCINSSNDTWDSFKLASGPQFGS